MSNAEKVVVVQVQREDLDGSLSDQLEAIDGPNKFYLASGEPVDAELQELEAPEGMSWTSNWKVEAVKKSQKFIVKAKQSSKILKYSQVKDRRLRMTTWARTVTKITAQDLDQSQEKDDSETVEKDGLVFEELVQEKLAENEQVLKERSTEIKNLASDIRQANQAMQKLASIVNDQNEPIDNILKQTDKAKQKTDIALEELQKAKNMQGSDCAIS